ncbi:MAG: hypothetical protein ACP5T3_03520 [Candidatus Micrarchaeia archaeon]
METELRKEYAGAAREIFEAIERKAPQDFSGLYYDVGQKYSNLSTNALIAILAKATGNEDTAKTIEAALDSKKDLLKYSTVGLASYALMKFVLDEDSEPAKQVVKTIREMHADAEEMRRYTFKEELRKDVENSVTARLLVCTCAAIADDAEIYGDTIGAYVDMGSGKLSDGYRALSNESKALLGISLYISGKRELGDAIAEEIKSNAKGGDANGKAEALQVFRDSAIGVLFAARGGALKPAKNEVGV